MDFIPRSDADFNTWIQTFITYASANLAVLGIIAADITSLQTLAQDFATALQQADILQQ
jgi:hypothetical protein